MGFTLTESGATDSELTDIIAGTWARRTDRYSEERFELAASPRRKPRKKIEMYQIGG